MSPVANEQAPPLVGRDQEVSELAGLLAEAKRGAPRFAQITGEAGIGKTYLLDELARRADGDGWLVLRGRCAEFEREIPFGLVVDAFDSYLAALDERDWQRIAPEELSELAGIFPSMRSLVPEPELPSTTAERFRAHRAVVEMIERLAARQPVLLILDDLHWADGASVEQAGYVLRRPPEAPVMIVGAFRAGQADPALVAAVETASRDGHVTHLALGPLAPDDAVKLLNGTPAKDGLYEESGGNPFYLLQLARSGRSDPGRTTSLDGITKVPTAVAATIASELERLPPATRSFASAAAVAGDPFDLDLATEIAELSGAEGLDAVDDLVGCDLARTGEVPREFQFRHPLVRTSIYAAISPGARLAAHERAVEALDARGAPATERAHHVEHAARRGDLAAAAVLREAGEEAAARAPQTAARWFEAALRLLPPTADASDRLALLIPLAGSQAAIGRFEEARESLIEAIALAGDDAAIRVRLISACAAIEQLLGRFREAHQRLEGALEGLGDAPSVEQAAIRIDLALDGFHRMDFDQFAIRSENAVEAARETEDPVTIAHALGVRAFALSCVGPIAEAVALREEAAMLIDSLDDEAIATRVPVIAWLASAEFYLDLNRESAAHCTRGLEIARRTRQGDLLPVLTQALANGWFHSGRPRDAGVLLDDAIDAARLTDSKTALSWSLLNRGFAALLEGDLETGLAVTRECYSLTKDERTQVGAWAGAIYGGAMIDQEDYAGAIRVFAETIGGDDASLMPGGWRTSALDWVAQARIGLGEIDAAERAAGLATQRAEEFPLPLSRAAALRARARVALARTDGAEAGRLGLESAAEALAPGDRVAAGFALMLAGEGFTLADQRDEAIDAFTRAAAEFEASSASRHRERAERELRKLGQTIHRRTRAGSGEGVGSLTGRELEVAELVVDRRTNTQIAAELFLSVKTVETHMRNIFRKLDVNSRVEVARVLEQAEGGS